MTRTTDTRERVREVADMLATQGIEPTPTVVRRLLGTGSASTIVDELRQWRLARERIAELPKARVTDEISTSLGEALARVEAEIAKLHETVRALGERVDTAALTAAHEVSRGLDRLEGVRKMALMSVEDAREQTRFWREATKQAREDAGVKLDAYRQAMYGAQAEARRLADELEVLKRSQTAVVRPPVSRSAPVAAHDSAERIANYSRTAYVPLSTNPDGPDE